MAFVKRKRIRGGVYYYLVESCRDGEGVKTSYIQCRFTARTPDQVGPMAGIGGP